MKKYTYRPQKVCSTLMEIYLDDNNQLIDNVKITNGCPGNTLGVSKLVANRSIDEVIKLLKGIDCRNRGTSCPDQLASALILIRDGKLLPDKE